MSTQSTSIVQQRLLELRKSKFRRGIELRTKDLHYLSRLSAEQLCEHAFRFVRERLASALPDNDGKQTPWRGHPVFVAQHATATCCRECLSKWHHINKGIQLDEKEIEFIVALISGWLDPYRARCDADIDLQHSEENRHPLFEGIEDKDSSELG